MFEWIYSPEAWIALVTLTSLEIVLGIDNIIFISILVGRLPEHQRDSARIIGLSLAMITRLLLLLSLAWMMRLTEPLFTVLAQDISGRDLILIVGGLFLLWKSAQEIWENLEGEEDTETGKPGAAVASYGMVLVQIAIIDIVFSLDSVITAVGMVDIIPVMVIAIVIAVGIMMLAAKPIGVVLLGEGLDLHVPKGYVYFAMAFAFAVEIINIRMRKKRAEPVHLHKTIPGESGN